MRRITVDLIGTQTGSAVRGIGRYTRCLAEAMAKVAPNQIDFAIDLRHDRDHLPNVDPFVVKLGSMPAMGTGWYLVTSPFEFGAGYEIPEPGTCLCKLAAVGFDLIPMMFPVRYLSRPDIAAHYRRQCQRLARYDKILAISDYSAREVRDRLGVPSDRVVTISGGVPPAPVETVELPTECMGRSFVLAVSSLEPHKNAEGLLTAWAMLPAELRHRFRLVITGSAPDQLFRTLKPTIVGLGLSDSVLTLQHPSDAQLWALYRSATLFVSPAKVEGLCLPLLEAMSCGTPCLVGNNSGQAEVAGDVVATVDVDDRRALSRQIATILTLPQADREELGRRTQQRAALFNWQDVARRAIAALN